MQLNCMVKSRFLDGVNYWAWGEFWKQFRHRGQSKTEKNHHKHLWKIHNEARYAQQSTRFHKPSIWNPTKKYVIDKLENIQRRFSKRVPSLSHLSYLERLSALGLEPLEFIGAFSTLFSTTKSSTISPALNLTHISTFIIHHLRPFLQQSSNFNKNVQSSFYADI